MAERRMFAKTIIDSDAFLDMPLSTQALYFHLSMRADDDGFLNNPKKIMRMVGASQNELELLLSKKFLLAFESGVVVIKHWKLHNYIQKDRYKETVYVDEKSKLLTKNNKSYKIIENQAQKEQCIQDGYNLETQVRLELGKSKDRKTFNRYAFIKSFFGDLFTKELEEAIKDHMKVRDNKKAGKTERAIKMYCQKLLKLSNGIIDNMIQIVDKSTNGGYTDIYELKNQTKKEDCIVKSEYYKEEVETWDINI